MAMLESRRWTQEELDELYRQQVAAGVALVLEIWEQMQRDRGNDKREEVEEYEGRLHRTGSRA